MYRFCPTYQSRSPRKDCRRFDSDSLMQRSVIQRPSSDHLLVPAVLDFLLLDVMLRRRSVHQQSFVYPTCLLRVLHGSKTWNSLTGSVWTHFIRDVNGGFSTSAGVIMFPMTKSHVAPVCPRLHLSSVNEDCSLFGHVARLPDNKPSKPNQILWICCKVQEGDQPSPGWRRAQGRPPTTWIHQIGRDTVGNPGD